MPPGRAEPTIRTGSAALVAALVGLTAAGSTMAIVSNFFDGGSDDGNKLIALGVGAVVAACLTIFFARRGMPAIQGVLVIALTWALTAVVVIFLYFVFLAIGCGGESCVN
jgi:hypothetical protein